MLNAIHGALQSLIRDRAQIDPLEVDVSFEVPTEEWVKSLTRPTIDLFLFDVNENTEKRETNPQLSITGGRAERRMPPRRIDLWYMVSILTDDIQDEHELLWRVLATLLKHEQFPDHCLPDVLRSLAPPMAARLATPDDSHNFIDIWSGLGTTPRPALCYIVTAPMDLAVAVASPLVLTRTARYRQMGARSDEGGETGIQIGGFVRDPAGRPLPQVTVARLGTGVAAVTDGHGRYALRAVPEGRLTLSVVRGREKPREVDVSVPAESYDIVLEG